MAKWRPSTVYANFHGYYAQYLANETELRQNILHTSYCGKAFHLNLSCIGGGVPL